MSAWLDLTGVPFSVDWVDAGGIPTRRLVAGEGPDVVFLHGTSGHLEAFTRNIAAHVAAGYRCHAIDMLGHGYTGKPDYDYEIPKYVEHFANFLDGAGIDTVNIAGESLGGWVAAVYAADNPDRITTLQLIASGGTKANPEVMERIKTSTQRAVTSDDKNLTRERLHLLMHDPASSVSEELVEVRHRIYHEPDFIENVDHLLCLQNMEIRQRNLLRPETLAKLGDIPTLIIWGNQNPFGDVPEARKMHEDIRRFRSSTSRAMLPTAVRRPLSVNEIRPRTHFVTMSSRCRLRGSRCVHNIRRRAHARDRERSCSGLEGLPLHDARAPRRRPVERFLA